MSYKEKQWGSGSSFNGNNGNEHTTSTSWEELVKRDFHTRLDGKPDKTLTTKVIPYLEKTASKTNKKVMKVVSIGALDGRNEIELAKNPLFCVHAIDLQGIPQFSEFRKKVILEDINIHTDVIPERGDLLFKKNSVDTVMLFRVLHLITNSEHRMEMISQCWDILKPGGILIASVRNNVENLLKDFLFKDEYGKAGSVLGIRKIGDVSRIYYGGIEGIKEEHHRFKNFRKAIQKEVKGKIIQTLNFEMPDEKEYVGGNVYDAPCINVAYKKIK